MLLYRLLNFLLFPLTFSYIVWKAIRHREYSYLENRVGSGLCHVAKQCIWLHCASVGEVNTALPLIRELHKRTGLHFIVTTNTPTGAHIVRKQKLDYLRHAYLPFDWMFSVWRFISTIRPRALLVLETELWPNLITQCHSAGIPLIIVNGRLSAKTTSSRPWIKKVLGGLLRHAKHIYARSEADADAFIKLGAPPDHVSVIGNLKFAPPASKPASLPELNRDYIVAASTHDDEEQQIAKCWTETDRKELLVIAPRHPERRDDILKQLDGFGLKIAVRSRNDEIGDDTDIYLLDTVGELNDWFKRAKLVIMGGSFVPVGGHNILEPAHFGRAVIFGPYMDNFESESKTMLDKHAAIQIDSTEELGNTMRHLLDNPEALKSLENNVAHAVSAFRLIVDDYADIIEPLIT